jgi:hypothetical protein
MAKVIVLFQRGSVEPRKMMLRGVFTQKKKVWETFIVGFIKDKKFYFFDDVTEKRYDASYGRMCALLARAGRAWLVDTETGSPEALLIETQMNALRNRDVDDAGKPRNNPVQKDETESSEEADAGQA